MSTLSPTNPATQGAPSLAVVLAPQVLVSWSATQTGGGAGAGLSGWPSDPCVIR